MYTCLRQGKNFARVFLIFCGLACFIQEASFANQRIRVSPNARGGYNYYQGSKQVIHTSKNIQGGQTIYQSGKFLGRTQMSINGPRINIHGDLRSGLGRTIIYNGSHK